MVTLHVLRVFTGAADGHGNPLGVFLDGGAVPAERRQGVATDLGFSETVFVDDPGSGRLRIFTPAAELSFAGHPLVGTAWLLRSNGSGVDVLRPPAGVVPTWVDREMRTWIRGRAEWAPAMHLRRLPSAAEVDALADAPDGLEFVDAWAWVDEAAGLVRSRVFAGEYGIPEDEATGAAAVRLVTALGRQIEIRQGRGSVIHARPGPGGTAEVGGTCVLDDRRDYPL